MVQAPALPLSLEAFLALPETEPASEFIDGRVQQKPMPKARHSRLQGKLIEAINAVAEPSQLAYAFPELRCTFGGRSIVPDIVVLRWERIALDALGEPVDDVAIVPDWMIEILSPDQSPNRVTGNILHSLNHGTALAWLIDPSDRSILVFRPHHQPELKSQQDSLLVLEGIDLNLSVEQVFAWLNMQGPGSLLFSS